MVRVIFELLNYKNYKMSTGTFATISISEAVLTLPPLPRSPTLDVPKP